MIRPTVDIYLDLFRGRFFGSQTAKCPSLSCLISALLAICVYNPELTTIGRASSDVIAAG